MLVNFSGETMRDVVDQILDFVSMLKVDGASTVPAVDTMAQVPREGMLPDEEDAPETLVSVQEREALMNDIKPVLTQAQMEENMANAPVHEDPPAPTFEEVRKALRGLRERKGTNAIKMLLADYGVSNATELTEVSYRSVYDRANAEV